MSHRRAAKVIAPYALLIFAAVILCLAIALALTGSLRSGKSDAQRYEDIAATCNKKYNDDMARGVKYTVYPCQDNTIQEEFKKTFGYPYTR